MKRKHQENLMPQAMAILLRKRTELTRKLENDPRRAAEIENELKALDKAIEYIQQNQLPATRDSRGSH